MRPNTTSGFTEPSGGNGNRQTNIIALMTERNSKHSMNTKILSLLFCQALLSPGAGRFEAATVSKADEASLRAALITGGGVKLAFDGSILLSQTLVITNDAALDATGHSVVISGQNKVRVFNVSSNAHFTLIHLTVANGQSDQGGGLYNDGGTVTALNCVFTGNQAVGLNGMNGIDASYMVQSSPGGSGSAAFGGAIYNRGILTVTNSLFSANCVFGGKGGIGGAGLIGGPTFGVLSGSPGGPGGAGAPAP